MDGTHDPARFGIAEDELCAVDRVGCPVGEALFYSDIYAERYADCASFDEFFGFVPSGRETALVTDDEFHAVGVAGLDHPVGASHADGHWFFADDGFDRRVSGGLDGQRVVQEVPGADADDVGFGVVSTFFQGGVGLRYSPIVHVHLARFRDRIDTCDYIDVVDHRVTIHVRLRNAAATHDCRLVSASHLNMPFF